MISEYLEGLCQGGHTECSVHRASPLPGVTAYRCVLPAGGERHGAELPPGRLEAAMCLTGRLELQMAGGHIHSVGPGELLLLTSQAKAADLSFPLAPVTLLSVVIQTQNTSSSQLPPPFGASSDLHRLSQRMAEYNGCLTLRDPEWSHSTRAALRYLPPERHGAYFVLRLMERLYVLCSQPTSAGGGGEGYCDHYQRQAMQRVHDHMIAHLDQPSTIEQLSQTFQLSSTRLKESFRRVYGKPIHTYLQEYRLQMAAHLLCTTSDSVLSIASQVGYSGTSRFNAAFKETYHVTPLQYRRLNGEKMSKKRI